MATRRDVARLAGVSEATVSYTLSGKKPISAATQQRVRTAMRQLGYRPHLLAAALAGGASPIIALLFPTQERGISNSDLEYVLGAASAARAVGHHLLLWPTADRDIDEVASLHASGLVAGVILMEVRLEDERIEPLREAGVPIALIGRTAQPDPHIPFADRDFAGAAELAVAHLAGLGHRRVCLLSAPERLNELGFGATIRTEAGFAAACEAHDVAGSVLHAKADFGVGRDVLTELGAMPEPPTAVVCLSMEAALGVLQAAPGIGLPIPDALSVVSLGSADVRAEVSEPSLTTVAAPAAEMGASAARQLIGLIGGEPAPDGPRLWAGELVARGSSGRVREG